ncbi:DegT/DnrJ/EryC1/StrS family aminotransferase [Streptomyces sp. NPDC012623]|uniref:DegT/DnrJ/EryC1/StrS family aminotransferase n=1 Tax=unclassified Streptomyces TaxID=2593676 RepID=UPI00368CC9CD
MIVTKYDYRDQFDDLDGLTDRIRALLLKGDYVLGPAVARFEERFAAYNSVAHAIGVNSGTDAIVLALRALDIGPGDEVVTVANTFHASVLAVTAVGARPVLVDCEPDTYLMDLSQLESAVTSRTRAVLVVHMFGQAVDMGRVEAVSRRHGLAVVEDCAQAVGARWNGRRVGGFGHVGCFSFHPSKNLAAAGDGGAIVTDDAAIDRRVRVLRGLGQRAQNEHVERGCNSKLDSVQALVLDAKLDLLDDWNARRASVADRYAKAFDGTAVTATPPAGDRHVFHLYQVSVRDRDRVLADVTERGVQAVVRYPVPIHRQPAFADLDLGTSYPHAQAQADHTMCLPVRPNLTDEEITYVAQTLVEATTSPRP